MKNLKPSRINAWTKDFCALKLLLSTILFLCFVMTCFAQTAWTTVANGGPDDLGGVGHFDLSTSTWTMDQAFTSPYPGANSGDNTMVEVNGKFYGISAAGGPANMGLIFEWDPVTNVYLVIHFADYESGGNPRGKMTLHNGKLYGTCDAVIFEIDPVTHVYTKKVELDNSQVSGLSQLEYYNGKFYGETSNGGAAGLGTIFEWDPAVNIYTTRLEFSIEKANSTHFSLYQDKFYGAIPITVGLSTVTAIYTWDPLNNIYQIHDQSTIVGIPRFALTVKDDKLYGALQLYSGGPVSLFEWNPVSQLFTKEKHVPCPSGSCTETGKLFLINDQLYSLQWGHLNNGLLFSWNPESDDLQQVINYNTTDVARPGGELVYKDLKYYALSSGGGSANKGTIYSWDPIANVVDVKISFSESLSGAHPQGSLTYVNGKFYGMTSEAGLNGKGTLFEWEPTAGVFTKLFDFDGLQGSNPQGGLVSHEGKLYGMTKSGGTNNAGVIFTWDLSSDTFMKAYDFDCNTGCNPQGELTFINGVFYGMTQNGGVNRSLFCAGVLFEWNPVNGTYTTKFNFSPTDGGNPTGALSHLNGKLYGMTHLGGATAIGGYTGYGVIFEYDLLTQKYTRKINLPIQSGNPSGSLTYHEGKFYGLTEIANYGSIFSWDPSTNEFIKRHTFFPYTNGAVPHGTLTYFNNMFYGVTSNGGDGLDNGGVLFSWDPASGEYSKKMTFTRQTGMAPGNVQLVITETAPFQYINFPELPPRHYATAPFALTATASSGLTIQYTSSNESVATISGDTIMIHGIGQTVITASQTGNETYAPAISVQHTLTVGKAPLTSTAEDKSRAVGQPNPIFTVIYNGFKASEGISTIDVLPTTSTTADASSEPGIYPIYVSGGTDDHYEIIAVKGRLSVTGSMPYVYVTSPTNGKIDQKIKLNLIAKTVPSATTYTIKISPEIDFTSGVITKSGSATQAFDSLEYHTTYYARVKTNIASSFGKITSFTTVGPSYYAKVNSPSNGVTNVKLDVNIVANTVVRASLYTIELNTDPMFNPATAIVKSGSPSLSFGALKSNTVYYNRVKTDLEDVWGETRSFTTTMAAALAYVTSPGNGSIDQNVNLKVVSNEVPGASAYTIQLSEADDFSTIAYESTYFQRTIDFHVQYNTTYYARVKTDLSPVFGATRSFRTKDPSRDTYITTPVDGATNVRYFTDITIRNIQGATDYTVELNTAPDFTGPSIIETGPEPKLHFSLAYNQRYYARAKTNTSSRWGRTQHFTTGNPVTLCSIILIVENNQPAPGLWSFTFIAAPIEGASVYTVEVSSTPDFTGSTIVKSSSYRGVRFDELSTSTQYYIHASTDLAPGQYGPVREFRTRADFTGARVGLHDESDVLSREQYALDAYPNPFTDRLNVYLETPTPEIVSIELTDLTGREVHRSREPSNTVIEIQTPITSGVYMLRVRTASQTKTIKVIKKD